MVGGRICNQVLKRQKSEERGQTWAWHSPHKVGEECLELQQGSCLSGSACNPVSSQLHCFQSAQAQNVIVTHWQPKSAICENKFKPNQSCFHTNFVAFMIIVYLLDELNVFPGVRSETVSLFQQGHDVGTWEAIFCKILLLHLRVFLLYL